MYLDGRRSSFPNEVDSIVEMFSIPSNYKGHIKRYQELSLKSNLNSNERKEFNDLMVELEPYIFDVEKWNRFGDILINMQKFFKEGVEPYIENEKRKVAEHSRKQIQNIDSKVNKAIDEVNDSVYGATQNIEEQTKSAETYIRSQKNMAQQHIDSKVENVDAYMETRIIYFDTEVGKLRVLGEWNPAISYSEKNIVTHEGRGYIALRNSRGQIPNANSEYWSLIADKGEKGDPSLNINFRGEYDKALSYSLGDAVTYNGLWYYAKKNTRGNSPINDEYWELSPHTVWVDGNKPFDQRIPLWIEV